jgi:P2-related tail formation protein
MALKTIDQFPKITDEVLFQIQTTNDAGLLSDPHKIRRLVIYYLKRDFLKTSNFSIFEDKIIEAELLNALNQAKQLAISNPTEENLTAYIKLQKEFDTNAQTKLFYYQNADVVQIVGSENFPAWLETDTDNALLVQTGTGLFEYTWNPVGAREGDYFICWEWEPVIAGTSLAQYVSFSLSGNTELTTSIPTHFVPSNKFETLLERYTPELFKQYLNSSDLTPEVIQEFNGAIAKGFESIENLGNQLLDIKDSNATHEAFLPILANTFATKLRSQDPTLWRRQIKRSIPINKKKGTYSGLEEALDQAGIRLDKFTLLWQITSPYTWQEYFVVQNGIMDFELSKVLIEPLDENNFKLYFRYTEDSDWTEMTSGDATFTTDSGVTTMTVSGLDDDTEIRVIYQYAIVPNDTEQNREDYIRSLPLADQRDPRDQIYPLVNWNVRVIEEDDAFFDSVIPHRHPFYDDVIYGHVRTEFPYSENIYNMEEYNGSIRESTNPCHIDRDFIDNCSACRSSMFNIDIEISNLSNIRVTEAIEIIKDYAPFHAVLHTVNFSGGMSDYVQPPIETISCLIRYLQNDTVVVGQYSFNRAMESDNVVTRSDLAEMNAVVTNLPGTFYNEKIVFYSSDQNMDEVGVSSNNVLEIISPPAEYSIENIEGHYADTIGVSDGFDPSLFTFNLSNNLLETTADIYQNNLFKFTSSEVNFLDYPIKTYWNIDHSGYVGGAWKVSLTYGDFEIDHISPDNELFLRDPSSLLPVSSVDDLDFTILSDADVDIVTGIGDLEVVNRGLVDLFADASAYKIGYYLVYNGVQYKIIEKNPDDINQFYISDYSDGNVGSANIKIYKRLINRKQGQFAYKGWLLDAGINLEAALEIQNGDNPPVDPLENGRFKQNYLILNNSEYYIIQDIDANMVTLSGPPQDWTIAGTSDVFTVYRFDKKDLQVDSRAMNPKVPGFNFVAIDREGNDIISRIEEDVTPLLMQSNLNNDNSDFKDVVNTKEKISFKIEYKNGDSQQGTI